MHKNSTRALAYTLQYSLVAYHTCCTCGSTTHACLAAKAASRMCLHRGGNTEYGCSGSGHLKGAPCTAHHATAYVSVPIVALYRRTVWHYIISACAPGHCRDLMRNGMLPAVFCSTSRTALQVACAPNAVVPSHACPELPSTLPPSAALPALPLRPTPHTRLRRLNSTDPDSRRHHPPLTQPHVAVLLHSCSKHPKHDGSAARPPLPGHAPPTDEPITQPRSNRAPACPQQSPSQMHPAPFPRRPPK
jgi:hypothetical protein